MPSEKKIENKASANDTGVSLPPRDSQPAALPGTIPTPSSNDGPQAITSPAATANDAKSPPSVSSHNNILLGDPIPKLLASAKNRGDCHAIIKVNEWSARGRYNITSLGNDSNISFTSEAKQAAFVCLFRQETAKDEEENSPASSTTQKMISKLTDKYKDVISAKDIKLIVKYSISYNTIKTIPKEYDKYMDEIEVGLGVKKEKNNKAEKKEEKKANEHRPRFWFFCSTSKEEKKDTRLEEFGKANERKNLHSLIRIVMKYHKSIFQSPQNNTHPTPPHTSSTPSRNCSIM